jgi:hypothetical protein
MENQLTVKVYQLNKGTGYPMGLKATSPTNKNRTIEVCFVDMDESQVGDGLQTWKPYPNGYVDRENKDSGLVRGTITEILEVRDAHKNYPEGAKFNRVLVECV